VSRDRNGLRTARGATEEAENGRRACADVEVFHRGWNARRHRLLSGWRRRLPKAGRFWVEKDRSFAMGLFTTPIKTLDDLFVHTLQDMYHAEHQIVKHLPEMVQKASNPELRSAFEHHLTETEGHVRRLEQVFQMHGQPAKGVECPAISGILSEARDVIGDCGTPDVCDAAMLSAAQAVEHYEITRYGTLIAFARQLGRNDCASVLQQTLEEEKAADKKLTAIADSRVNRIAA
jgi:ferritin-like metal-binding protein YciE